MQRDPLQKGQFIEALGEVLAEQERIRQIDPAHYYEWKVDRLKELRDLLIRGDIGWTR